jgi:hypothetical protein
VVKKKGEFHESNAWKIMSQLSPKSYGYTCKVSMEVICTKLNCIVSYSEKLLEFNRTRGDGIHKVQESYLEGVVKLAGADATANPLYIQVLKQLLEWPQGECELYLHVENWCILEKENTFVPCPCFDV